jgi:threonine aldolase
MEPPPELAPRLPIRQTSPMQKRHFASDNYAGSTPEAWAALEEARHGDVKAYGEDQWTGQAANLLRDLFETDCDVYFVFNGTAANSLALATCCQSYHSILCHELAHVETDECGAPEFFSNGTKLLLLPGANGKIDPDSIERVVKKRTDLHFPKPRAVSMTNATETGTTYSPAEVGALGEKTKALDLRLHMDGARFANAVASLGCTPKDVTWKAGVDVLCFGGTKQGLPIGEAVVFFNRNLSTEFEWRCKQAGQLSSKMRFLSASWVGMLREGAWLRHAAHANAMAARLELALRDLPGVKLLFPRQANAVFAELPRPAIEALWARGWLFYTFIGAGGCRFMCSWDTREADVDAFAADIRACLGL